MSRRSAQDQARVVAAILQNPDPHDRQIYPLVGAQELDHPAIARQISEALGMPVKYEPIEISTFAKSLSANSSRVLTGSVEIEAEPTKVWALLNSAKEIENWYDDADTVTNLDPQDSFRVGSKFVLTRSGVVSWYLVTSMEPLRRLSWTEEQDGKATVSVEFRLDPLSTDRTRLTHSKAILNI